MQVMESEGTLDNCRAMGELFRQRLGELCERLPHVLKEVRGTGLFQGLEIGGASVQASQGHAIEMHKRLREVGQGVVALPVVAGRTTPGPSTSPVVLVPLACPPPVNCRTSADSALPVLGPVRCGPGPRLRSRKRFPCAAPNVHFGGRRAPRLQQHRGGGQGVHCREAAVMLRGGPPRPAIKQPAVGTRTLQA